MPKKFVGENSKAAAAKERRNAAETSKKEAKEKAIEDAKWEDNDKSLAKKQSKKEDAERKRVEALAKKKEREDLLAAENKAAVGKVKAAPAKVTQSQIREEAAKREEAARRANNVIKQEPVTHLTVPLEENLNRVEVEGDSAHSVTEAIQVLSLNSSSSEVAVDKHPEKRMKAAYEDFEKVRLPILKSENSNMRLSQLKQMLRKEWQKHPDNPLNKQLAAMANNMAV